MGLPVVAAVAAIVAIGALAGDKKSTTPGGGGGGGGGGGFPPIPGGGGGGVPPLPIPPIPGGGGGGVPPLDLLSCDAAFAQLSSLAPPLALLITNARATNASAGQLNDLANVVEEGAGKMPDAKSANNMHVMAQCLRAEAAKKSGTDPTKPPAPSGVIIDHNGVNANPTGGAARDDCATNPAFEWVYVVQPGDNANIITRKTFGVSGVTGARVAELISTNPTEFYHGRNMGIHGTPGAGDYNWSTLLAGDGLRLPRSWNQWISQKGTGRNALGPTPWPVCG